jgi:hypothetical protein
LLSVSNTNYSLLIAVIKYLLKGPEFVNNPEMSDVTFVVEGELFYAHRIILVAASSKFKAMLSAKFPDGTKPRIEIPNMKYDTFKVTTSIKSTICCVVIFVFRLLYNTFTRAHMTNLN